MHVCLFEANRAHILTLSHLRLVDVLVLELTWHYGALQYHWVVGWICLGGPTVHVGSSFAVSNVQCLFNLKYSNPVEGHIHLDQVSLDVRVV